MTKLKAAVENETVLLKRKVFANKRHILLLRTVFCVGIILQGGHFFTPHKILFGSKKLNICSRRLTLFTLCCIKG